MDDLHHDLEAELKALRPRQPSEVLRARLETELERSGTFAAGRKRYTTATSLTSWKWLGWRLGAGIAVLALAAVGVSRYATRPAPAAPLPPTSASVSSAASAATPVLTAVPDVYRPVSAASVLYDLKDEGTVYVGDRQPARQARFRYVDTVTWTNPRSRASLKMSVPRDEVRVLPASFN